jgi:hypothetical protein
VAETLGTKVGPALLSAEAQAASHRASRGLCSLRPIAVEAQSQHWFFGSGRASGSFTQEQHFLGMGLPLLMQDLSQHHPLRFSGARSPTTSCQNKGTTYTKVAGVDS